MIVAAILCLGFAGAPQARADSQFIRMGKVPGGTWYGAYIPGVGGANLYADILLPRKRQGRIPTVMMIGPYFQHVETNAAGVPVRIPADRYNDFVYGSRMLERGYAIISVDLRGYGASDGCPDTSGAVDRGDLRAVVRWAATRSWSSGKIGLYGKSYDGVTGLMAAGERIPGLAAVVAQEPVYDWYRYLYSNGVPRTTRLGTPLSLVYTSISPRPPNAGDRQWRDYMQRSAVNLINPMCIPAAFAAQQNPMSNDRYWRGRSILAPLKNTPVPIFLSQGFIDQNTAADGLTQLLQNAGGRVTGWLGMWDHVRGTDTDASTLMGAVGNRSSMGRRDYLDQVAAFYDHYLLGKGTAPSGFLIQDNTAAWRAQPHWPLHASTRSIPLKPGVYRHNAQQVAVKIKQGGRWIATQIDGIAAASDNWQPTLDEAGNGVWTLLPAESAPTRISGAPEVTLSTRVSNPNSSPITRRTPVAVDLYDVGPAGEATLITQNVAMLSADRTTFQLYATDWLLRAGHRLAIRVTDSNRGRWDYPSPPNGARVTVTSGRLDLPLSPAAAGEPTTGTSNSSLDGYLARYRYPVPRR